MSKLEIEGEIEEFLGYHQNAFMIIGTVDDIKIKTEKDDEIVIERKGKASGRRIIKKM